MCTPPPPFGNADMRKGHRRGHENAELVPASWLLLPCRHPLELVTAVNWVSIGSAWKGNVMTNLADLGNQVTSTRDSAAEVAGSVIGAVPDLLEATTSDVRSVGHQAGDHAQRVIENVADAVKGRIHVDLPGARQGLRHAVDYGEHLAAGLPSGEDLQRYSRRKARRARDVVDHLNLDIPDSFRKNSRSHAWRRAALFVGLGLGIGLLLNLMLRRRGHAEDPALVQPDLERVEAEPSETVDRPAATSEPVPSEDEVEQVLSLPRRSPPRSKKATG
jgi:hypothetical protein